MTVAERLKSICKNAQDDSGRMPKINLQKCPISDAKTPKETVAKTPKYHLKT
jgi:hypothetical protein